MRLATAALAIITLGAASAAAEPMDDCRQSRNGELRLQACTALIANPATSPDDKAAAYRHRGQARADAGAGDLAIADFTQAISLKPHEPAALTSRGYARLTRGDEDGALADFTSALVLAPNQASSFVNRGYAYTVRGLPDLAIADFNEAIRLKPDAASTFVQRGLAWRKKGDDGRAIDDFTTAIGLNPVYALAYNNRGYAYEAKGLKTKAIEDFVKALLLDGSLIGASTGLKRLGASGPLASESDALIQQGKALADLNCSRCHATGATGPSPNSKAPEFRRISQRHRMLALREPLSRGIAATHDEMPKFKFTNADIDGIIAYINSLPTQAGQ